MLKADSCVFCKMVAGEIPVTRVYEDSEVLAFLDINPISDGHSLVIPKQHVEKLDESSSELLGCLGQRLPRIARAVIRAIQADGYNVLCNNGAAAGQAVEHLHFHIIPRRQGDGVFDRWPAYKYEAGKMEELADKIRQNFEIP